MDSKIRVLEELIMKADYFTFGNFCHPSMSYPGEYGGADTAAWLEWKTRADRVVSEVMAEDSSAVKLVKVGVRTRTEGYGPDTFANSKESIVRALQNALDAIKDDVYGELKQEKSTNQSPAISNKIFVVHGHDNELKNDVERFLHEIGLEPVVLHRQVDAGATVIEKIEANSDVGYAFVLLTPDELAYTKDQQQVEEQQRHIEWRARPNVIFEFGLFVGKLGRERVCCLHKGDVTIPSDLSGLVYKKIDSSIETQAFAIIKELKAAGYQINI